MNSALTLYTAAALTGLLANPNTTSEQRKHAPELAVDIAKRTVEAQKRAEEEACG
jgi:hypothetical protein